MTMYSYSLAQSFEETNVERFVDGSNFTLMKALLLVYHYDSKISCQIMV